MSTFAGILAGPPPLSLELVCGQTGVDPEHPGYWEGPEGGTLCHPAQERVRDLLRKRGIRVDVSSHEDDGYWFSDAYVKFYPEQLPLVAAVLREAGHPGDILDIKPLPAQVYHEVLAAARREGWVVGDDENK